MIFVMVVVLIIFFPALLSVYFNAFFFFTFCLEGDTCGLMLSCG